MEHPTRLQFSIPLTPPSVNHYVTHGGGFHRKHPEAQAWERDFPIFARQQYVVSESKRFQVKLEIFLGPKERGDVDNFAKCPLDCIARAWMLRGPKLESLSDACVKRLEVVVNDSQADRELGPMTRITIEAL